MQITRITIWQKSLPLKEPYWLSGGSLRFDELDSTFVRLDCGDALYGWGEACPWGHTYLPAFGGGIRAAIELLAPVMLGKDSRDIASINRALDEQLPGHGYAKSALDIALWDLAGRRSETPLYQLLGGADGEAVMVNSSIATGTPDEMLARINRARERGYRVHSAKIGGPDAKLDIARIDAIEAARLPDESITYDVNRAWTPATAIEVMNSVAATGWFEQPCETLSQCAEVRRFTRQPIMLDECMLTFQDHLDAWKENVCQGVKVKPNRLGGLTRAKQVRDFGVAVGWQMHVEDVGGTVFADTAAIHLALSTPRKNRLASWLCHPHLVDDYDDQAGARNRDGLVALAAQPGAGIEPPKSWLGEPIAQYE